jgi:DNA polymerase III subunit epsilon
VDDLSAMREVVFDTETTGLSPANGDRLVEIGCIEMINRVETGKTFHAYFNPERAMPIEAQNVHGLSEAFLVDKPLFAERVEDLLDFLGESPLVAHNASFDFAFLNHELKQSGRLTISHARMVDTIAIARAKHPGAKHSLDALCIRYGIDRSHRIKHGALLDAELLAQLYVELTGGRQIGLHLVENATPSRFITETKSEAGAGIFRQARTPRPHSAEPDEAERHRAFMAKFVDPVWTFETQDTLAEQ